MANEQAGQQLFLTSFLLPHGLQYLQEAVHEMAGVIEFCVRYRMFLQEPRA